MVKERGRNTWERISLVSTWRSLVSFPFLHLRFSEDTGELLQDKFTIYSTDIFSTARGRLKEIPEVDFEGMLPSATRAGYD